MDTLTIDASVQAPSSMNHYCIWADPRSGLRQHRCPGRRVIEHGDRCGLVRAVDIIEYLLWSGDAGFPNLR
jgi:hypothetical protein